MNQQQPIRIIGNCSPITVSLINILSKGKPGDSFTDDELTKKTGGISTSVGGLAYACLHSAIRYCEKNGIIWKRQPKENKILCLNADEVLKRSHGDVRHIRRHSRRAAQRLSTVDPNSLQPCDRPTAMALGAQLGAIMLMSKSDSTKKLISNGQSTPQIGDAFKIFDK